MLKINAPGPDGVLTEMLVASGEYGLEEHTRLINIKELNKYITIILSEISGITKSNKKT